MVPCVIFEDEHLLAVNKPAGWNTHAPSLFAGEGIYDWLKHREPRWASLAIIHRLDKETSGVLVFGKTQLANRSLTEQFAGRRVQKKYLLLTDRPAPQNEFTAKTALVRAGEKYVSRPGGEMAETKFRVVTWASSPASSGGGPPHEPESTRRDAAGTRSRAGCAMIAAEPLTGRTHQIRVHAAESGFPILGDTLYGGTPAPRVFLHAAEISLAHPATAAPMSFSAPEDFGADSRLALRRAVNESNGTNATSAFRVIHGASDGWSDWFVDKLGDFLLSESAAPLTAEQTEGLIRLAQNVSARGAYHKILSRQVRRATAAESSPQLVLGAAAPARFEIIENGLRYEMSFGEGYSVGLFLDQRDNRRRFLTGHVAADFQWPIFDGRGSEDRRGDQSLGPRPSARLNCFAYTCGFCVCAAKAGVRTTSLDLSKKYLAWGKRNFELNGLDPAAHDFIYGDAFDWLRRLAKQGRAFDIVALDPPTFSQSKEHGIFRAEKDFRKLVAAALPVLKPGGILFASTNAADWPPAEFLAEIETAIRAAGREIMQRRYFPQPPDFPISRAEPAYLKTAWLKIG